MTSGSASDVRRLEDDLSRPTDADVAAMARLSGDLVILGVAGKMGPTLARLALRASRAAGSTRRIVGVSRFSNPDVRERLESWGVRTVRADLLRRRHVQRLPRLPNVILMAGRKFGTSGFPGRTWASNIYLPALVAEHYRASRIVAFSSGNVYSLTAAPGRGPDESTPPGPVGEYAQSVLGRERILEHFSETCGTPVALMRLNYAVEPRYGVLRDVAERVRGRTPVDVSMGYVNVIWQRDANSVALRLLERTSSPPLVLNVTGPEALAVRALAGKFGQAFGIPPAFDGSEGDTALLSDASRCRAMFPDPLVGVDEMVHRIAGWMLGGGSSLGKPTHFEERAGAF